MSKKSAVKPVKKTVSPKVKAKAKPLNMAEEKKAFDKAFAAFKKKHASPLSDEDTAKNDALRVHLLVGGSMPERSFKEVDAFVRLVAEADASGALGAAAQKANHVRVLAEIVARNSFVWGRPATSLRLVRIALAFLERSAPSPLDGGAPSDLLDSLIGARRAQRIMRAMSILSLLTFARESGVLRLSDSEATDTTMWRGLQGLIYGATLPQPDEEGEDAADPVGEECPCEVCQAANDAEAKATAVSKIAAKVIARAKAEIPAGQPISIISNSAEVAAEIRRQLSGDPTAVVLTGE